MRIDADTSHVRWHLERLADLVDAAGGHLLPRARVRAAGTRLVVEADTPGAEADDLVALPAAALPAINRADVVLEGDRLIRRAADPDATPRQTALLDTMLALYNALDRPAQWRRATPWLALADDPDLLRHLARGRDLGAKGRMAARMRAEGRQADLALKSFLGSRSYQWLDGDRRVPVLMPFIDFLDHHWDAPSFERRHAPAGLAVRADRPRDGDPACYVRYGRLDGLTSYLNYAFVDGDAPIVNSVPATVTLDSEIKLQINGKPVTARADAARFGFAAAPYHVPRIAAPGRETVCLDHAIVTDTRAPWAPLALFERLVGRLRPGLDARARRARAEDILRRLVEANEAYYTHLRELATNARAPTAETPLGRDAALEACARLADQHLRLLASTRLPASRPGDAADA